ncbi:hypothetical protein HK103_005569 [Boothiomyces macroporosus]|uniref:Ribosome biogenesis protein SLX9 n=1 Tax=Boothiomyces macroporosus TaxID=261099 RepID=A0AAD5Y575_9FUNG|nr:hypothetical protein HK103_005569 [Boothiomyces macroporosus]
MEIKTRKTTGKISKKERKKPTRHLLKPIKPKKQESILSTIKELQTAIPEITQEKKERGISKKNLRKQEMNRFGKILELKEFKSDPLQAIQMHLMNSIPK